MSFLFYCTYQFAKADDAAIISLRLHDEMPKPYEIEGHEIYITSNIGICHFLTMVRNKEPYFT